MALLVLLLVGWLVAGLVTLALLAALFRGARLDDELLEPPHVVDDLRPSRPRPRAAAVPAPRSGGHDVPAERSLLRL